MVTGGLVSYIDRLGQKRLYVIGKLKDSTIGEAASC